tara:strand:+ start:2222 stop:2419 length:198 start_codon:yes stop_codon:yes gene_type:complete
MLKLNPEETQVLKYILRSHWVKRLPPAIKEVAFDVKNAMEKPKVVTQEEYVRLNPNWKHCENCDD